MQKTLKEMFNWSKVRQNDREREKEREREREREREGREE